MTTIETADGAVAVSDVASPVTQPAEPTIDATTVDSIEPTIIHEGGVEIFDFSVDTKPIKFRIDNDTFEAIRDLPALSAMQFGQYATTMDTSADLNEQAKAIETMFRLVLTKESAERFIGRLTDVDNPIGARQMNSVMVWLMEKYGFRPTVPSEPSSDGS